MNTARRQSANNWRIVLLVLCCVAALLVSSSGSAEAASMPSPYNPPGNIPSVPSILSSGACTGNPAAHPCPNPCVLAGYAWPITNNDPLCGAWVLAAIDHARAEENVGPMVLPTNFYSLSLPLQQFIVLDLERVDRGYPPYLGLNANLTVAAQQAAQASSDPQLAANFPVGTDAVGYYALGGSWSSGYSPLEADYYLMYSDGWGGSTAQTANLACTGPTNPACWAHRDELLGADPGFNPGVGLDCTTCEVGTGFAPLATTGSFTDLIELPAGSPPPMTFTWAQEAPFFTGATSPVTTTTVTLPITTEIVITRSALSTTVARVQWSSNLKGIFNATLRVYHGPSCARLAHGVAVRYAAARSQNRAFISSSGHNYFDPTAQYSARVTVTAARTAITSNCLYLGVS